MLDIIDVLPAGGVTRTPTSDLDLDRSRALRLNHDAWRATLRDLAPTSEFNAYVWLSFACASETPRRHASTRSSRPTAAFSDAPLIAFRRAICRSLGPETHARAARARSAVHRDEVLPRIVRRQPADHGQDKLDEADQLFDEAYAWRPEWPALTQSIANIAMTVEEFERAALFYDRTLALEPHAVDALLGKARALTYLGRSVEAIATLDSLLAERWFVGDARYWRALNESELERNDEAWTDIELAAKLLVNAEVPKLAGLIAYRRHELDVSRAKFDESRTRNPRDCETGYYLGVVLAEQRAWPRTAEVLREAADCLQGAELALHAGDRRHPRVARSARAAGEEDRPARAVHRQGAPLSGDVVVRHRGRVLQPVEAGEARQYAEKVVDDEQFGDRAKEILSRLSKSP